MEPSWVGATFGAASEHGAWVEVGLSWLCFGLCPLGCFGVSAGRCGPVIVRCADKIERVSRFPGFLAGPVSGRLISAEPVPRSGTIG